MDAGALGGHGHVPGPDTARDPLWEGHPQEATEAFASVAARAVEVGLRLDPAAGTALGDHRRDGLLPDLTREGAAAGVGELEGLLADLDAVDDLALGHEDAVDLEILRAALTSAVFRRSVLRAPEWDPRSWSPAPALVPLLERPAADVYARLDALLGRLSAVPGFFADARATLGDMPLVHVETALAQLQGLVALLGDPLDAMLAAADASHAAPPSEIVLVAAARDRAISAVYEQMDWLVAAAAGADRDPRLGPELYAAALWHTLDEPLSPEDVLALGEAEVERATMRLESAAARWLGVPSAGPDDVERALASCAAQAPIDGGTILPACTAALHSLRAFLESGDGPVTPVDHQVDVVEMPEVLRGVSAAYCEVAGALEADPVPPAHVAVSPPPVGWDAERVRSFYRQYHGHFLPVLMAHEGVPGHALQLARARRVRTATDVRKVWSSGLMVEGWAVHAEQLVEDAGYEGLGGPRGALAFSLQRSRLLLRSAVNAVLDVRVHAMGLQERDAMALMRLTGHQEPMAAAGKWRRALLTHGQLTTYVVGSTAVARIEDDLAAAGPGWGRRQVRDAMLSYGSPGPRHLRALLDLPA